MAALYVGDLHSDVTEPMLVEKFSPAGPIHCIRLCRDRKTGSSLGYAYINFQHQADAERALEELNFELLMGQPMRIMWSQRDSSLRKTGIGNLFIKNLDKSIDSMALFDTFSIFGKVLSCKVVRYEKGSKGYGYVHYNSAEAADLAMERLNGKLLNGRKVFIEHFKSREERKAETGPRPQVLTNIYIKNFGDEMNNKELKDIFSKFGPVVSVRVMTDENGKSRRFGFVRFERHEDAQRAVDEMNGKELNGKKVYVGQAQNKVERQAELKHKYEQGLNLYVKNLDGSVDDEHLRTEFSPFGTIINAKVMTENGRSKGFGFVRFSSPEEAMNAIKWMNGRMWGRKALYVGVAQRKEERQAYLAHQNIQRMASMQTQNLAPNYASSQLVEMSFPHCTVQTIQPQYIHHMPSVVQNTPDVIQFATTHQQTYGIFTLTTSQDVPTYPPAGKVLTIYMLESAPVDDQIQMAHDYMLPLVEKIHPTLANKITWMLLEGENNYEIMNMIGDPELLRARCFSYCKWRTRGGGKMQEDHVYDYPDAHPVGEKRTCPQRGSLKSISVLDRLLLTYPVWLQLSINSATALHILQREPPGTFLVRKSSTSQKKMLCLRLADDSVPSFVKQFVIREKDSTFSLESSAISFPDLCRLIAFYCVSRDVLPFTLELPEAIAKASSHKQLESISHMGVEFWSSQLNFRGPRNGPPPVPDAPVLPNPKPQPSTASNSTSTTLFQEFCPIHTRSPSELDLGAGQGALCFINPLFLQEHPIRGAMHKRHHFKRSIKVRVSTENSSSLSPPVTPPPPPPLLAKAKCKGKNVQQNEVVQTNEEDKNNVEVVEGDSDYVQPCLALPKKTSAIVTTTLSPTAEEDDYQLPKALLQAQRKITVESEEENEDEDIGLVLEKRKAPSLTELDSSSSLSSLDETEESPQRPSLTRGTSNPISPSPHPPHQSVSALRKMSAAFVSFFVPGKRVIRLVEDLSHDRRMAFGALVQDFLREQREALKPQCPTTTVELLQGLRLFINQAKVFLLECGELEPPIETLVPEDEKDQTLEKALFRCVLKPLKEQIDTALYNVREHDGSFKRLAESMKRARDASPRDLFGVQVAVPDAHGIEKIKHKMSLMRRAYSPIDKVVLLLQICKLIYKAMKTNTGQEFGADDFLPALSYVIVQCNMPELSLEVEYMMELLETSWLTGEGGYYLTSVYASLSYIQSEPEAVPSSGLNHQVKESLKEWSHRRSTESKSQNAIKQRFVKVLFQDGECSLVKTLQWKAGFSGEALAQLCAIKFGVDQPEEYGLYWRNSGKLIPVSLDDQIQDLQNVGTSSAPLINQHSNQDMKSSRLTRGGALDLSGEAS
ncbi:hypothetical protein PGIGA_G00062640 [Pangasianodon gigas]|uniref:Uncharacterized protein n=1 Tax=Pangasianodon gigas TaxID=30993 RepID=A0ACC5X5S8_PANGG|nr:hypothetical protein [Pangasianodon gigas]